MDRYAALVEALRAEIPGFRIVHKADSPMHRAIDVALRAVTLGRMRDYLENYQTTIGRTVYVTSDWDALDADRRYITLRHEAIHLRQFRRWSLPVMALLYIFVPLPLGLAYCRARFEQAAYAETIHATYEVHGLAAARSPSLRAHILEQFTSASYGWMWPFPRSLDRWYDGVLRGILAS